MKDIMYMDVIKHCNVYKLEKELNIAVGKLQNQLDYEVEIQYSTSINWEQEIEYSALVIGRKKGGITCKIK